MGDKTIKVCVRRGAREITPNGYDPGYNEVMEGYEGKQIEVEGRKSGHGLYRGVGYSWCPEWLKFKNNVVPDAEE